MLSPTAVGVASGALAIGAMAALVSNYALQLKNRLGLDDSLDVLPVHGVPRREACNDEFTG